MPGFDKTGPQGMGSMTGGSRGLCNPTKFRYGRDSGCRRGFIRSYGRESGFYPTTYPMDEPMDQTTEIDMLKAEAVSMKNALEMINRRIDELGKTGS